MELHQISEIVSKYGFPIIAAGGLSYFIYYTWTWATTIIKPELSAASTTLIGLIDRIRMLDNDIIRLNTKLKIVQHLRETEQDKLRKFIAENPELKSTLAKCSKKDD